MIKLFKKFFSKKKEPNLKDAQMMLKDINGQFDNVIFYISQIKNYTPNEAAKAFSIRAAYNLNSFHDELMIEQNKRRDKEFYERFIKNRIE